MAEPDLKQGVDALKNRFDLQAPVTRQERDAERIRYERDIAPRLESITESYDRITKRRQDARLAEKRELELDESIKKLKAANAVDNDAGEVMGVIGERYNRIKNRIANLHLVPNPDRDDVDEAILAGDFVPASVAQMKANFSEVSAMYSDFNLMQAISTQDNHVNINTSFKTLLAEGDKKIQAAEKTRNNRSKLVERMEELQAYHKEGADKYELAVERFRATNSIPEFKSVVDAGHRELDLARRGATLRLKEVQALRDEIVHKRRHLKTDPRAERTGALNIPYMRAAHDPIFVGSVYNRVLSLIDSETLDEDQFKALVGRSKEEAQKALDQGQYDDEGERAEHKPKVEGGYPTESKFDKFTNDLYKNILLFLDKESTSVQQRALRLGVPAPDERHLQVDPDLEDAADDTKK